MPFYPCPHKLNLVLIRCAQLLWPREQNISILIKRISKILNVAPEPLSSSITTQLPAPADPGPRYPCPRCKSIKLVIEWLCGHCKDAEGGKFKTKVICEECGYKEISPLFVSEWFKVLNVETVSAFKEHIGIATHQDKEAG